MSGGGDTRLLARARPLASKIQVDFTCGSDAVSRARR